MYNARILLQITGQNKRLDLGGAGSAEQTRAFRQGRAGGADIIDQKHRALPEGRGGLSVRVKAEGFFQIAAAGGPSQFELRARAAQPDQSFSVGWNPDAAAQALGQERGLVVASNVFVFRMKRYRQKKIHRLQFRIAFKRAGH